MIGAADLIRRIAAVESELCAGAEKICARTAGEAAVSAREHAPVETGALRGSIAAAAHGLNASVAAGAPYAAMVEYGTSRMEPRPFMLPAAQAVRGAFFESMRALAKEVSK